VLDYLVSYPEYPHSTHGTVHRPETMEKTGLPRAE
jgi:hypothetical protein